MYFFQNKRCFAKDNTIFLELPSAIVLSCQYVLINVIIVHGTGSSASNELIPFQELKSSRVTIKVFKYHIYLSEYVEYFLNLAIWAFIIRLIISKVLRTSIIKLFRHNNSILIYEGKKCIYCLYTHFCFKTLNAHSKWYQISKISFLD